MKRTERKTQTSQTQSKADGSCAGRVGLLFFSSNMTTSDTIVIIRTILLTVISESNETRATNTKRRER